MPVVPGSLAALLFLFAGAFTAPSFQTFRCLVVGFLARVGDHTVCGMLQAARLAGRWHHSRAHDFFTRARWSPDELGLALLDFLLAAFLAADAPLRLAVDDTLFGRSGRKVAGCHFHHDGAAPLGSGRRTRWGNNWVVVGLLVELPFGGGRAVCLPLLLRLWRPRDERHPERPSQSELARELTDMVAARSVGRRIEVVADAGYASKAWRGLPAHVTVTLRLRANAALYAFAPPRTGKRGRPALKGQRLGSLGELARGAVFQTVQTADGNAQAHVVRGLWYSVFHTRPVQVVLVRGADRDQGFDIAILSTDTDASAGQLIERYGQRWAIETCFQEAKQTTGVGQARNRTERAVQRTVPFGFLCQSLVIAWYALHGDHRRDLDTRRKSAPWYTQKATISYQDMLTALRRELIRAQLPPRAARHPTPPQITHAAHTPARYAA